jgi:peptidoglycan/LPS O-acetylase OafA/YrhL
MWYPVARVSYGLYLLHPFALVGWISFWPGGQATLSTSALELAVFTLAAGATATLCATLMFLAVERPLLDAGTDLSRRWWANDAER